MRTHRFRLVAFAIGLGIALTISTAPAPAAVDMVAGPRHIVTGTGVADCNAKAKTALNAVLTNAFEAVAGTGEWIAYGVLNAIGKPEAAAAVHCYPLDNGYLVTFTCAVQLPTSTNLTANDLCTKLDTAFGAKAAAFQRTTNGGSAR